MGQFLANLYTRAQAGGGRVVLPEEGPAIDAAAANARALGVDIVRAPWNDALDMLKHGSVDALVAGKYTLSGDVVMKLLRYDRGSLRAPDCSRVCGVSLLDTARGPLFFADTAVQPRPIEKELAEISNNTSALATKLGITPFPTRISYKTDLKTEQVDSALDVAVAQAKGRERHGPANVLIFPDLISANSCYKAFQQGSQFSEPSGRKSVRHCGPIYAGFQVAAADLSRGASVGEIVDTIIVMSKLGKEYKKNSS